jgi:hypothetical protein
VSEIYIEMGLFWDRNNKFFYATTIARRKNNGIKVILHDDDNWITDDKAIRGAFVQHFKLFF